MSKFTCGFAKRPDYKHWVSSGPLKLSEALWSASCDRESDHKWRLLRNEIGRNLHKDQEAWLSERANDLKAVAVSDNCWKLFQIIRAFGTKKFDMSETICVYDGLPVINIYRRLEQ